MKASGQRCECVTPHHAGGLHTTSARSQPPKEVHLGNYDVIRSARFGSVNSML